MVVKRYPVIAQFLYGVLFAVILPVLLVVWARETKSAVGLAALTSLPIGLTMLGIGLVLMIAGFLALHLFGEGLPMNPFPPSRFVTRGAYGIIAHPIYTGFVFAVAGVAIASGSASGLWLVTPVTALGCAALVLGYEKQDLQRRFGTATTGSLMSLPTNAATPPNLRERISVYLLVLLPWVVLYEAVRLLGIPCDAVSACLPFERNWPIHEWTEAIYASAYLFVILVPLVARRSRELREFSLRGIAATGLITALFVLVPLIAVPRPFQPENWLGKMLVWERSKDTAAAAFPSFHVLWALLAAQVYVAAMPRLRFVWWTWALAIAASCVTTGMHALVDVIGAVIVFAAVNRLPQIWECARSLSESLANSWREWCLGPVRVINHGAYVGVGVFVGLVVIGTLMGPISVWQMSLVASCGLIMAGLWAQLVEGSSSLLRPFGYYGGVVGVGVGLGIVRLMGGDAWLLVGAFAVAAPWIQAFGRLRCLVNGCCHGRATSPAIGISCIHPRSRVSRLAGLAGVPIHPTQTYSILWNVATGLLLARLWSIGATLSLIGGLYLILNGLGRFVEEAYRGEPQTRIVAGLRLYQWLAFVSLLAGAVLTTLNSASASPAFRFNGAAVVAATILGLCAWFAMGVDFPNSNRRFSRLA